jgi:hypothetical protein
LRLRIRHEALKIFLTDRYEPERNDAIYAVMEHPLRFGYERPRRKMNPCRLSSWIARVAGCCWA